MKNIAQMITMEPDRDEAGASDFGLRREAKRHAALEFGTVTASKKKRCRRCALPPHSKIFGFRVIRSHHAFLAL